MQKLLLLLLALIVATATAQNNTYKACGLSSPYNFKTWVGSLVTASPLFYPKTENELRQLVKKAARVPGCKVRVVGIGGSADGVVQQKQEKKVIVVNLNDMQTNAKWDAKLDTTKHTVRMGAGKTFLDLMALVRPRGYILETRPMGKYFTLGGVFMNPSTHGATLTSDRIAKLATGFRVLLSNGKFTEITKPNELAMWRGSMGLLGIVVAIEIKLKQDEGLVHMYQENWFKTNFTAPAINAYLKQTMLGNDAVHWFWNFWSDKIMALGVNNRADPTFNFSQTAMYYMGQQMAFPNLGKTGIIPINPKSMSGMFNGSIDQLGPFVASSAEQLLKQTWLASNILARDGFIHETGQILSINSVETLVKCPVNCVDDMMIFTLLSISRQVLGASLGFMNPIKPWFPNLLVSFRIIKVVSGGMLLDSLEPGYYVDFEIEDAKGLLPGGGHRQVFQRLERAWRSVQPNPKAHAGKEYGFGKLASLDDPYAFQDVDYIHTFYKAGAKKKFREAMNKFDRAGLFRAGSGLLQVGAKKMTFDPRSKLGEGCESTGFCLEGCCCTFIPTCAANGVLNQCVPCSSPLL